MTREEVLKWVDAKITKCEEVLSSDYPQPGGPWWPLSPFTKREVHKAWKVKLDLYKSIRSLIEEKNRRLT